MKPLHTSGPLRVLTLLLAASLTLRAQLPGPDDPANLAGERVSPQDLADTLPLNHGAPALQQLLRKLRTRASFMLIVAHPDDEDGGLLTYLSRGQGARVAMLTLNRGEGGQNLMSADFDDALGLIRTQELLAADRTMGVDQLFGTEVDFGFSKTKEEAFAKWTHERVLYDAVRAVRLYRPLVIASVFIGAPSDGHGQHQVSGQIAQEVFSAAGDPNVFPDQISAGLQPWQPLKVYARTPFARIDAQGMFDYATNQYTPARFTNYVTGKVTTTIPKENAVIPEGEPATYAIPDGTKVPIPGMDGLSYIQFAREGLALQKTQIGKNVRLASPGPHNVGYHRYGSHLNQPDGDDSGLESSLFEGIDTSLEGIADLDSNASAILHPALHAIDTQIAAAQQLYDPNNTAAVAPLLADAEQQLDRLLADLEVRFATSQNQNSSSPPTQTVQLQNVLHELRVKWVQLNQALALSLSLKFEATASSDEGRVVAGTAIPVHLIMENNSQLPVTFFGEDITDEIGKELANTSHSPRPRNIPVQKSSAITRDLVVDASATRKVTRPYFSRPDSEQPVYNISQLDLRNAPATPPALVAHASIKYKDQIIHLASQVHDGDRPIRLMPALSIHLMVGHQETHAQILPNDEKYLNISLIKSPVNQATNNEKLLAPDGWLSPTAISAIAATGETQFRVTASPIRPAASTLRGQAQLPSGQACSEGFRSVGYPGLVYTDYYTPAIVRVVPVDVATAPKLNVAYLPGTGDEDPEALEDLGVHPHLITMTDLTPEALKPYDAIILGVRPYAAHPDLAAANPTLNAYAAAGGVVIVQYDTGRLPQNTGPYPLDLGDNEKVVEENAPVRLVSPADPLLNWPNKITTEDFNNWVEERGHGFMSTWDSHYTALLETHDQGQQPQLGGLLVARTGRGAWIYLGLALYRQFPEGIPGAYRLLANLISAAKNPAFTSAPNSAR